MSIPIKITSLIFLFGLQINNTVIAQYAFKTTIWTYRGGATLKGGNGIYEMEIYNADSLLIEKRGSHLNDSNYNSTLIEYNSRGQKTSETDYYHHKVLVKRNYAYTADLLQKMSYQAINKKNDTFQVVETYYYDENDQLIRKSRTAEGYRENMEWEYTYEYKDSTKTIREYLIGRKKKKLTKKIIYNNKGLEIFKMDNGYKAEYSYEYNSRGQWIIKKIIEKNGKSAPWIRIGELRRSITLLPIDGHKM